MFLNIAPSEIISVLENDFRFQNNIIFCQMSTVKNDSPHIRTVRLYGIEDQSGLIFLTRTTSKKWQDLSHNPHLAICLLHPEYRIQLQAECTTKLISVNDNPLLFQKYWSMIRDDVKKIYHDDYVPNIDYQKRKETNIPSNIPNSCGMIMAIPHYWEYLFVNDNYPESIRYQFTYHAKKGWIKSKLTMS